MSDKASEKGRNWGNYIGLIFLLVLFGVNMYLNVINRNRLDKMKTLVRSMAAKTKLDTLAYGMDSLDCGEPRIQWNCYPGMSRMEDIQTRHMCVVYTVVYNRIGILEVSDLCNYVEYACRDACSCENSLLSKDLEHYVEVTFVIVYNSITMSEKEEIDKRFEVIFRNACSVDSKIGIEQISPEYYDISQLKVLYPNVDSVWVGSGDSLTIVFDPIDCGTAILVAEDWSFPVSLLEDTNDYCHVLYTNKNGDKCTITIDLITDQLWIDPMIYQPIYVDSIRFASPAVWKDRDGVIHYASRDGDVWLVKGGQVEVKP